MRIATQVPSRMSATVSADSSPAVNHGHCACMRRSLATQARSPACDESRPMRTSYSRLFSLFAACGVLALPLAGGAAPAVPLGVALPQSGIDGAAALQQRDAFRLAVDDLRVR